MIMIGEGSPAERDDQILKHCQCQEAKVRFGFGLSQKVVVFRRSIRRVVNAQ
jgi:hypothetical protein